MVYSCLLYDSSFINTCFLFLCLQTSANSDVKEETGGELVTSSFVDMPQKKGGAAGENGMCLIIRL